MDRQIFLLNDEKVERVGNITNEFTNFDFPFIKDTTRLSGVTFENRQSFLGDIPEGTDVKLVRDYENRFDKNAIKALVKFKNKETQIGWIPKDLAELIAPEIDCGLKWSGKIHSIMSYEPDKPKGVLVKLSVS